MSVFFRRLLSKIQNNRPEDVSQFIQDNNFDVVETLEKIAFIPIEYPATIVKKGSDGNWLDGKEVNLKFYPVMYVAVLNEEHSLEMVAWLHRYMPTSIEVPLVIYDISLSHKYYKEFIKQQEFIDCDYCGHAINHGKLKLLNYLFSFANVKKDGQPDFESIGYGSELYNQKESEFMQQKLLFENKDHQALMDAMENGTLVYSVLELAKDNDFVEFCQENGSGFSKQYMDNAQYELGFTDRYGEYSSVDDPDLKAQCRQKAEPKTATPKASVKERSMFDLGSMSYVVGGIAAAAGLAAYSVSRMHK